MVSDDAYFGLFYGEEVARESLFAKLVGCHERLLAVKVDGPTKEEFVWGFRTGMLTFGARAFLSDEALQALEKKVAGAIRSAVSNCSHVAQSVLAKAMCHRSCMTERREKQAILEARAKKVQAILASPKYAELWEPYPFNAGYFMCLKLRGLDAETYRKHLLEKYGVGVIADGERDIRIAFSSVDEGQLEDLYEVLATAARDLLDGQPAPASSTGRVERSFVMGWDKRSEDLQNQATIVLLGRASLRSIHPTFRSPHVSVTETAPCQ